jgi:hypothetical protein
MSCGMRLCIECGHGVGLSWGDTDPECPRCGGTCVFGNNKDECESLKAEKKAVLKEADLVFDKEQRTYRRSHAKQTTSRAR